MQKIKLVVAAAILAGAFLTTPAPVQSESYCPAGCVPCFISGPITPPVVPCCKANTPQRLRCTL